MACASWGPSATLAFPVQMGGAGGNRRTYSPVNPKDVQAIVKAIADRGINSAMVSTLIDRVFGGDDMLPFGIKQTCRLIFDGAGMIVFKQEWDDNCAKQLALVTGGDHPLYGSSLQRLMGTDPTMITPQAQAEGLRAHEVMTTTRAAREAIRSASMVIAKPSSWSTIKQRTAKTTPWGQDPWVALAVKCDNPPEIWGICTHYDVLDDIAISVLFLIDTGADITVVSETNWPPHWKLEDTPWGPTLARERHVSPFKSQGDKFTIRATAAYPPPPIKLMWKSSDPVWFEQWPLSKPQIDTLLKLVDHELQRRHVEPSTSPWNFRVFVIPKQSGEGFRLLHDLREVNNKIQPMGPMQTSLPMNSMIPKGQPCAVLDIKNCFFSIPLYDEDKEPFAFSIVFPNSQRPNLHFQWKVLPQEMVNKPTICQITEHQALEPVQHSNPTVTIVQYMDDILIAAPPVSQIKILLDIKIFHDMQQLLGSLQWLRNIVLTPPKVMDTLNDLLKGKKLMGAENSDSRSNKLTQFYRTANIISEHLAIALAGFGGEIHYAAKPPWTQLLAIVDIDLPPEIVYRPQPGPTIFTDTSSLTSTAAAMWQSEEQWQCIKTTDLTLSVQQLEAAAIVLACRLFPEEHLNIVTDSIFVAKLCLAMSRPGVAVSTVAMMLEEALFSQKGTISVIHVNSHNPVKGFFQIGNDKTDAAAKGLWTLRDARQLHESLHIGAKALAKKCGISTADAKHVVATCPHCQKSPLWSSGVNPRGLKASEIWQTDFTLCQLLKTPSMACSDCRYDWIIGRPHDAYTLVPEESDEPLSNSTAPKDPAPLGFPKLGILHCTRPIGGLPPTQVKATVAIRSTDTVDIGDVKLS
ncbi:hypothetical protein DUI87_28679 [Hirundo rustica rustica]|uniref:ribonuclease H n=1 Tax=Hirundo rustica rustica TaxID=333673 RepID=A0A3M0J200_HIRRU|nr:hypothetical protein DUI87_28679 [Hirundo rustica rustica]